LTWGDVEPPALGPDQSKCTDPRGGICPGPLFSQASWAGPASGWASAGGSANGGWSRSRKSDRSAAAASPDEG